VLPIAIASAREAIKQLGCPCEIIVSDNGSTDNSVQVAEQLCARVVLAKEKGYGAALSHGFSEAKGRFFVMGDADGTYDFTEATLFVEKLRSTEADFVIGSRIKGNMEKGANPFLHRYLGTPVLSFIISKLFHLNISDCNCGMRALTKQTWELLGCKSTEMEFASEMLCRAGLLKLRVLEIPCSLYKGKSNRKTHLKPWRDGWRHLKLILAIRFKGPGANLSV